MQDAPKTINQILSDSNLVFILDSLVSFRIYIFVDLLFKSVLEKKFKWLWEWNWVG